MLTNWRKTRNWCLVQPLSIMQWLTGLASETLIPILPQFTDLFLKTSRSYTNVKVSLMMAGVNPLTLTAMDSGFMFTYAGGSFITGQLGDRFSPVVVVGVGLLGSTFCLLLIVYGASTSIVHNVTLCGTWFLTSQLLHGAFQATGGPVSKILFVAVQSG